MELADDRAVVVVVAVVVVAIVIVIVIAIAEWAAGCRGACSTQPL